MEATVPSNAIRALTPEQVEAEEGKGNYCWNISHVKGAGYYVVSRHTYIGNAMNTSTLGTLQANVHSKFLMRDGEVCACMWRVCMCVCGAVALSLSRFVCFLALATTTLCVCDS